MRQHSLVNKAWRDRNPEKAKAHLAINNATRKGTLTRQPCEVCGSPRSHAHHDDYSKRLDVRWLCAVHHKALHRNPGGTAWRKPYIAKKPAWLNRTRFQPAPKRDACLALARAMRADGRTYKAIADALGVTKGTVYKWLNPKSYA